jgi:hypothetical protein
VVAPEEVGLPIAVVVTNGLDLPVPARDDGKVRTSQDLATIHEPHGVLAAAMVAPDHVGPAVFVELTRAAHDPGRLLDVVGEVEHEFRHFCCREPSGDGGRLRIEDYLHIWLKDGLTVVYGLPLAFAVRCHRDHRQECHSQHEVANSAPGLSRIGASSV